MQTDDPRTGPLVAELTAGLESGRLSRRAFIARATSAGVSASMIGTLLAACGSGGSGGSSGTSGTSSSAGIAAPGQGKPGGTAQIAVAAPSQKASLDPFRMASNPEQFMTGLLYDPLVNVDEDTWAVKPGLAEKWEAGKGAREWTFGLRPGVEFHDGKPLTSADVVYTIKRHLDPKQGSPLLARLSSSMNASGVQAVDKHTVKLVLTRPDAYLPVALSYCWAGILPAGNTDQGLGTGPFRKVQWKPGQGFEMSRNPSYWMPNRPYLDTVRAIVINDPTAKVQSVVAGSSHITDYVEPSDAASASGGSAMVLSGHGTAFQPIVFPAKVAPWNNPKVIQALKLAVDRNKMVSVGLGGHGVPVADVLIPPTDGGYPTDLHPVQDIAKAKALLKEAGFPNGLSFTLNTSDAVSHIVNLAVTFAETVAPAGIKVNVQKQPVQTYFDQFFLGKRPYVDWWNREQVLDNAALLYRTGAPFNETNFASKQFDDLLSSGQGSTNPAQANKYFADAMRVLSANASQVIAAYSNELLVEKQGFLCQPSLRYIVDFRNAYFS
jgi:peptide/nickel transport system substrate-binding protein